MLQVRPSGHGCGLVSCCQVAQCAYQLIQLMLNDLETLAHLEDRSCILYILRRCAP